MARAYPRKNTDGSVSYKFYEFAEDINNWGKNKDYTKYFRVPPAITTKKEIDDWLEETAVAFRKEVNQRIADAKKDCIHIEKGMLLMDYWRKWLVDIERSQSHFYYERGKETMEKFKPYLQNVTIDGVDRYMVQNAIDDMCRKEIGEPYAKLKNMSTKLFDDGYGKLKEFCNRAELTRNIIKRKQFMGISE